MESWNARINVKTNARDRNEPLRISACPLLPHFRASWKKILTVSWFERRENEPKATKAIEEKEPAWWSWRCFFVLTKKKKARDGSTRRVSYSSSRNNRDEVESASDTHFQLTYAHTPASGITKENHLRWSAIFLHFVFLRCANGNQKCIVKIALERFLFFFRMQFIKLGDLKPQRDELSRFPTVIYQSHKGSELGLESRRSTMEESTWKGFLSFFVVRLRSPWKHAQFLSNCNFLKCFLNASLRLLCHAILIYWEDLESRTCGLLLSLRQHPNIT